MFLPVLGSLLLYKMDGGKKCAVILVMRSDMGICDVLLLWEI